jgi:inosine/xanthosine triphosphatase
MTERMLPKRLKVAVGSTNPTKIAAVRSVFKKIAAGAKIEGIEVKPDAPPQPMGVKQVVRGAVSRARAALELTDADLGIGIEGGTIRMGGRWYNLGFVAVIDRQGRVGTGTSGWFECPPMILQELKRGKELAQVMSELTGDRDIKYGAGAIGTLTRGAVDRTKLYEHGVWMAMCRFLSPEFFGGKKR